MAHPDSADQSKASSPDSPPPKDDLLVRFERANRALRTLSAVNHVLLHATDEQELLRSACQAIVAKGGYRGAVVGYAGSDEEKIIRWTGMVHGERPLEFSESSGPRYTWADSELGQTATGIAIRTGRPCVGRHILTDPAYAGHAYDGMRAHAAKQGYAATSSFPLHHNGDAIGALTILAAEPDAFDDEEVKLLNELAADLAYGIANLRMRIRHCEAQATIARMAFYDPLTGLPNRTLLLERLKEAIAAAGQQHRPLALLHLGIGSFQDISKALGFRSGDRLLEQVARLLAAALAEDEAVARVGEADFAVPLPRGDVGYAIAVAQRLLAVLQHPVDVSGLMLDPHPRIGIALYPWHATDAEMLLRRAKAAMHEASPGAAAYALYRGGQEQEFTRRISLMGDLRRAIEEDQLQLYCQPKVAMSSHSVCGAEALVRWQHPVHGMLSTMEFIRLAEQSGLITPLTHWMLDATFRQSHAWRQEGLDLALSVNLSAHDLHDPGLIDRLKGLFSTWGIAPDLIQFELTESALMKDPGTALETLVGLKQLGVQLYIDDYGTGYSSLSYLQKLPMDWIKIDQAFVMPMAASRSSAAIVHSTIELGHELNLKIVAEGVESRAVWDSLARLGCDVAQGYLISTPMLATQFRNWEKAWPHALPDRLPGH